MGVRHCGLPVPRRRSATHVRPADRPSAGSPASGVLALEQVADAQRVAPVSGITRARSSGPRPRVLENRGSTRIDWGEAWLGCLDDLAGAQAEILVVAIADQLNTLGHPVNQPGR